MTFTTWSKEAALAVLEPIRDEPGPVLVALQNIQAEFGFVPPDAVSVIAEFFNVSRADVHGVLTFYHDLRNSPPLANQIQICVAEACQAVGSRDLEETIKAIHGDQVSDAFCFGNCALGPAVMVNGKLIGRATAEKISQVLA